MTLHEVLRLMAEYRREDPSSSEIHDDRIMQTRRWRYDRVKAISLEHDLPRSYSTLAECREMAKAVFAGARVTRSRLMADTMPPGKITDVRPGEGVFEVGLDDPPALVTEETNGASNEVISDEVGVDAFAKSEVKANNNAQKPKRVVKASATLLRPQNLKGLE
jgi:hypothetical protein